MRSFVLVGALVLAPLLGSGPETDLLDRWFPVVLPTPAELEFREIPWRPTLWEAVVEGQRDDKPILLWAMNGHPLGCT